VEEYSDDSQLITKTTEDLDFKEAINKDLSASDQHQIQHLLQANANCFATSDSDIGSSNLVQHGIDISNNLPTHQQPYIRAGKQQEIIGKQVGNMLRDDVVEPSKGPFAAPVVLVRKPDGTWQFCVDYRRLNAITTKDVYPLPRIDDALSRLEGAQYFSIMDMQAGYWQVQMKPEDREKTAFIPTNGPIESYAFWPNQCSQYVPTNDGCLISRIKMEQFVFLSILTILSFFRKLFLNIFSDWNSFSKLILTRSIKFIYSVCERDILLFL
jgi:hypothetical protein